MTLNSSGENEEHNIPWVSLTNFEDHFMDCMPQLFFRPQYVWFLTRLLGSVISNSSGPLEELIVYIIPPE